MLINGMISKKYKGDFVRYSDLHLKHIYYVNFDPVVQCEFNGKHLAVVLKKNNDNRTVIVAPLTTSANGVGTNKIALGYLTVLPKALRSSKSYLVYNQTRTVNCNRFTKVIYASSPVPDPRVTDDMFIRIMKYCINDLLLDIELDAKIDFHYEEYIKLKTEKLLKVAYLLKKKKENGLSLRNMVEDVKELVLLVDNISEQKKYFSKKDFNNGIFEFIKECIKI